MASVSAAGGAAARRAPPPNAAPAHLFEGPASSSSLVLYGPELLRQSLHNALAQGNLEDVQLCCDRGTRARLLAASLLTRPDPSRANLAPVVAQAPALSGATTTSARA